MSDSIDDERERILEEKKRKLQQRLKNGDDLTRNDAGVESLSEPISIENQAHFQEVVNEHGVVLVDCYADWCGPCQMLEPTIESLAVHTDATVAKVDVDAHQRLAQQLGARGVPTLVLYANGEPVERMVGVQDRATLEGLIEQHA